MSPVRERTNCSLSCSAAIVTCGVVGGGVVDERHRFGRHVADRTRGIKGRGSLGDEPLTFGGGLARVRLVIAKISVSSSLGLPKV